MVYEVITGDCRETMRSMEAESIDAIVTDPPYGLSFMGKGWDKGVPGEEFWVEALRVAKPGAHLLAFGGTRMVHRLAVAIEDAGWEIRDRIHWVYGSGFPKSHNISKAIDRAAGVNVEKGEAFNVVGGTSASNGGSKFRSDHPDYVKPTGQSPQAQQWDGWGTALKPAVEPIIMARKPFKGTVAANVLEWGTGAINVDGCRVEAESNEIIGRGDLDASYTNSADGYTRPNRSMMTHKPKERAGPANEQGRFPANLIHDGSDEVLSKFPQAASGSRKQGVRKGMGFHGANGDGGPAIASSSGSAARFFYCPKASKADRGEANHHPTVKPTELMAYLCRLITPPGGTILDPFNGSGSTGKAAVREGFNYIGCELEPDYADIARARIGAEADRVGGLFGA